MNNIFKIFIFLVLIFLFFQYRFINKNNNIIDIYQADNPNKDEFEKILNKKSPSIFTNVSENFFSLQEKSPSSLYKMKLKEKKKLINNLKKHFSYYNSPMCIKSDFNLKIEEENSSIKLKKVNSSRLLISQLIGKRKLILFSPNQKENLYVMNNKDSIVDFFKHDLTLYPLLAKTKYVEVILYPGHMIYIPNNWYYGYINEDESLSTISQSENIFSKFFRK